MANEKHHLDTQYCVHTYLNKFSLHVNEFLKPSHDLNLHLLNFQSVSRPVRSYEKEAEAFVLPLVDQLFCGIIFANDVFFKVLCGFIFVNEKFILSSFK